MPLVDYPDSDSIESEHEAENENRKGNENENDPFKRKRENADADANADAGALPPLPSMFLDLYTTAARTSINDDPSLHGGRKRQVPHVQGNWPTHLFLEWYPTWPESRKLSELLELVRPKPAILVGDQESNPENYEMHPLHLTSLSTPAPLHISLSSPLILKTHECEAFQKDMETRLHDMHIRPFTIVLDSLRWVSNEDSSRWFLVAGIGKPANNELNRLLFASNSVARSWAKPGLYETGQEETEKLGPVKKRSKPNAKDNDTDNKRNQTSGFGPNPAQPGHLPRERDTKSSKEHNPVHSMTGLHQYRSNSSNSVISSRSQTFVSSTSIPSYDSCYHISLGWRLGGPENSPNVMNERQIINFVENDLSKLEIKFEQAKLKVGNQVHVIPFIETRKQGKGILG